MHTSHVIVHIAYCLAIYWRFRVLGVHLLSVVVFWTLTVTVINMKRAVVLPKVLKAFLNGIEMVICCPNVHGYT